MALAVHSVAATRLGRFADADNDTESTILSAAGRTTSDPFSPRCPRPSGGGQYVATRSAWPTLRDIGRQHQMYLPFAEFLAVALLRGAEEALEEVRPRWTSPRSGLGFRNLGFHMAQLEAAVLAGNLEIVGRAVRHVRPCLRAGSEGEPRLADEYRVSDGGGSDRDGRQLRRRVDRPIPSWSCCHGLHPRAGHRRHLPVETGVRLRPRRPVRARPSTHCVGDTGWVRGTIARSAAATRTSHVGGRSERHAVRSDTDGDVHRHRRLDAADVERRQRGLGRDPRRAPSPGPLGGRTVQRLDHDLDGRWILRLVRAAGRRRRCGADAPPSDRACGARSSPAAPSRSGSGWPADRCSISGTTRRAWPSPRRQG